MNKTIISEKIAKLLYQFLLPFMLFALAPGQILKMIRRKDTAGSLAQRLGNFSPEDVATLAAQRNGLWIHAVSVGEANIAARLIREWRRRYPRLPILLTTTTTTGRAVAQKQLGTSVGILHNPLDFLPVVRKFLNQLQPRLLVLVESELWPNYIWEAERRCLPIALVNARVSRRSEKRYSLFSAFLRPLYDKISIICAQSENDAERLLRLGARRESIQVVDSMKFDVSVLSDASCEDVSRLLQRAGFPRESLILLGGSTHAGEEQLLANIYRQLIATHQRLRLILVPRHVERCASLARSLEKKGFRVALRKQLAQPLETNYGSADILLVDTTGELKNFYSVSHVTFVGKSLFGRGGQNFLEPVQFCHPVIVGPNMDNFSEITDYFVRHNAIIQVKNSSQLKAAIARCLEEPKFAEALAMRAQSLFHRRLGATRRTIEALDPLVIPALPGDQPPR